MTKDDSVDECVQSLNCGKTFNPNKIYFLIYNLPHNKLFMHKGEQIHRTTWILVLFVRNILIIYIFGLIFVGSSILFTVSSYSHNQKNVSSISQTFYFFFTHMGLLCSQ